MQNYYSSAVFFFNLVIFTQFAADDTKGDVNSLSLS